MHLAHHILHDSSLVSPQGLRNTSVLELGAGTGFLSIFLAQQGASVVTTDLGDDPSEEEPGGDRRTPLASLAHNIALSTCTRMIALTIDELALPPTVQPMDWFESLQSEEERSGTFKKLTRGTKDGQGVVVAADVVSVL